MKEEDPYSNREIREFVGDIKQTLGRIETQTTKTNGRVSKLENWRWWITGGLGVVIFTFSASIVVIGDILSKILTIK